MGIFDNISQGVSGLVDQGNEWLKENGFDDALNKMFGVRSSSWQGLNNHLIAKFYPVQLVVDDKGNRTYPRLVSGKTVAAPLLEGAEMEYTLNWQQPFEQMGTEVKAPALTAMLQSGVLGSVYEGFMSRFKGDQASSSQKTDDSFVSQALKDMEGRTGITKLNSTQTFAGMPPVKCTMKLLFRAYDNAKKEVNDPIKQLLAWAVPQKLSPDSSLVVLGQAIAGERSYLDALLPSVSPTLLAMEYKGRVYSPMVIESISDPITSPTTQDGYYAKAEVSITLSSLTAWDQDDIKTIYRK